MELFILAINTAVSALFFVWVIVECFIERKKHVAYEEASKGTTDKKSMVCAKVTVLCNIVISISYVGSFIYEVWMLKIINLDSIFPAMIWLPITAFTIHCKRQPVGENNIWPLVLKLWWFLFGLFNAFIVSIFAINHFEWATLPQSFPTASVADFISFPLCIFLCFNAIARNAGNASLELKRPFLRQEEEEDFDRDAFANAGMWSRLTFRWLNPLFETGRKQKLKLDHVPSVPESESAEKAFGLLTESLFKKKTEVPSLSNAIIHAIWRPLAINAVFAGIKILH